MRLEKIGWHDVPLYWPAIKDWVTKALSHGAGYWPEDIYRRLLSREMTLWLVRDAEDAITACAITQFWSQPRVQVCDIFIVGGEALERWAHLITELEDWARARGADETRALGRIGWKRYAEAFGYEPLHVVYRKRLK